MGGEPPTPGGSNRITSTAPSNAVTKGSSASRLAPMPLISSNGIRGSRLHVYPGGHLGLLTEAAGLAPVVDGFLAGP